MRKRAWFQSIVIFGILGTSAVLKFQGIGQNHAVTEKQRFERVLQSDRKILQSSKASDADIYSALVRLGSELDPLARSEALARMKSPSALVRSGTANALGFFEDEQSLEGIQSLLQDSEISVRVQALIGVGHRSSLKREEFILQYLKRNGLGADERATALSTWVQVAHSESSREKAVLELVSAVHDQLTSRAKASAAAKALAVAPRNPRVLEMLERLLQSGTVPELEPSGIRHLAAVGSPWLQVHIEKLAQSPNPQTRLAVIQSLHSVCPTSRFELLQQVFEKEIDINVRSAAFEEIGYLVSPSSIQFLEKIIENKKLSQERSIKLNSILEEHKAILSSGEKNAHNFCARKI